jgi:fermentation-respiration switch protein FrsA (DUF1100 family)
MTNVLINLAVIIAFVTGGLYLAQPAMVFQPGGVTAATPDQWGLEYEDVWLRAEDGVRLHGWYLPRPGSDRVLLFFHGNGGNISHRQASLEIFHRLGLNQLIIDYRGYGVSEGRPTEPGLYRDARAAWEHLVEERGLTPDRIVLFGRSLGGAVAANLAAEVRPGALILESTFSSARDLTRALYPLLSWLIVRRYELDTVARLAEVSCPVLVLHSPDDEIVPYTLGRRVYDAAGPPKAFQMLRGDHNGGFLLSQPDYERSLAGFLSDRLP